VRDDIVANWQEYFSGMCGCLWSFGSEEAEDAAQEALVELWCHPQKYDGSRGSVRGYLLIRARSIAKDHHRDKTRRREREARRPTSGYDPRGDPEDQWARCPHDRELVTATTIAVESFVWRKELARPFLDAGLLREVLWRCLGQETLDAHDLVLGGLCATPGGAPTARSRLLTELRGYIEPLGFVVCEAGSERAAGDLTHEALDQYGEVKCRLLFEATADLEPLRTLLDSGTRLVVVRAAEHPSCFRSPLIARDCQRTGLLVDANHQPVGELHAQIDDHTDGSVLAWVVCPVQQPHRRERRP